jgi:hypothetical protein
MNVLFEELAMPGIMLVKQRVEDVERFAEVFNAPELDAVRRRHGLGVTATYADADDPNTIIVVMEMDDPDRAREYARSMTLADARQRAGAVGGPDGVWYGPTRLT